MGGKVVCPKCGGEMATGHVLECQLGQSRPLHPGVASTWLEGPPEASGQAPLGVPVRTFRCGGCGYLESYAQP
jgi:hypothetical protein